MEFINLLKKTSISQMQPNKPIPFKSKPISDLNWELDLFVAGCIEIECFLITEKKDCSWGIKLPVFKIWMIRRQPNKFNLPNGIGGIKFVGISVNECWSWMNQNKLNYNEVWFEWMVFDRARKKAAEVMKPIN